MRWTWDEAKRIATLTHRGLDFAEAAKVFAGDHFMGRPTTGATMAS
jgi:uncharacterized DUF497 family protein